MSVSKATSPLDNEVAAEPLFIEDVQVGDRWPSPWRKITAQDVEDFARLTGDHDPLHEQSDARSPFGQPVVHGLLGLGVMAGLSTEHPRASTLALVGVADWTFDHPIFFGDQVQVITEVEQIEPYGRRAGRVVWFRQLLNQDGRVVQQGRIITLVARRLPRRNGASKSSDAAPRRPR